MADQESRNVEADRTGSDYEKTESFDDMNLNSDLLRSLYEYGLERPFSIQQRAIMPMIKGNDVILQAPSGTGKTIALCISVLQTINSSNKTCQAMILTSSADMARQFHKTVVGIGQTAQIECRIVVGGHKLDDDIRKLQHGQQVVVGTPGRVLDLVQRHAITLDDKVLFVLDEADETFSRGFAEHILAIHQLVPETAQVVFSSTTMPDDVLETAKTWMRDPLHIVSKRTEPLVSNNKQFYTAVEGENVNLDILSDLIATLRAAQAVVFCNTRKKLEWLANELATRGITTSLMHGDMPAFERADIMEQFRSGSSRILLVTNLLARGLDVQRSSLILNYELPASPKDYIHRMSYSARSARQFTRQCITVNLIDPTEICKIHDIDQYYSIQVQELSIPAAKEILDFMRNNC